MLTRAYADSAKAYLEEVCRLLDKEHRLVRPRIQWRKPALVPAVSVGLVTAVVGCSGVVESPAGLLTGEICGDGDDNDGDGKVDCADPECNCGVPVYAAPQAEAGQQAPEAANSPEAPVFDSMQADEDGGIAIEEESACLHCGVSPAYMVPIDEVCNDGKDNDSNDLTDCDDPSCASSPYCSG